MHNSNGKHYRDLYRVTGEHLLTAI